MGAPPPPHLWQEKANRHLPRSQVMMVFLACRRDLSSRAVAEAAWGSADAHVQSTDAAGFWGPRCSVLDPWLRREAKPERTLGPGATVSVLGTGVPGLACLRPMAWLRKQAVRPIFISKASKTLARGQASRGGRRKTSLGVA